VLGVLTRGWLAAAGDLPRSKVLGWVADLTNIKAEDLRLEVPGPCAPLCDTPGFRRDLLRSLPTFDVVGPSAPRAQTALTIRESGGSQGVARLAGAGSSSQVPAKRPRSEAGGSSGGGSSGGGSSGEACPLAVPSGAAASQAGEVLPPPPPGPPPATAVRAALPTLVVPARRLVRGDGTPVGDSAAPQRKKAKVAAPPETSPRRWRVGRLQVVPR